MENEDIVRGVTEAARGNAATLTLQIVPAEEDEAHVRLTSFIGQLEAFKDVLRHTERSLFGREGGVYYRVVALSQNSPAFITIEAVPAQPRVDYGAALFAEVLGNLETLSEAPENYVPRELDLPALLAYQNFAPTPQRHISALVVGTGRGGVRLDRGFGRAVQKAIGPDQITRGDVVGALEVINLHRKQRFEIFPTLGDYRVLCRFAPEKKVEVIAALDKYVRVTGYVHYKQWSTRPHAIDVERIEVLPDEDDIQPIELLRGMSPAVTEEQLEAVRDALW